MTRMVQSLQTGFHSLFQLVLRHSASTLVLATLSIVFCAYQLPNLPIELDLYEKTQPGFQSTFTLQNERIRFGDLHNLILIFSPTARSQLTERDLCTIKSWIHNQQITNADLISASSPLEIRTARNEGDKIWYRPYLNLDCNSPDTSKPFDLSPLQKTPWRNVLTSKTSNDMSAEFIFQEANDAGRFGKFDPASVQTFMADAQTFFHRYLPEIKLYVVGSAAFQAHLKSALERDIFLQAFVFIFLLLAFRWLFGTWRSGLFFVSTVIIDLIIVYGLMALFRQPLDLLTNNLTMMTVIAGLEDFIFLAFYMKINKCSFISAAREMMVPCFFTTLTTLVGFLSLESSSLDVIGRFGFWAGVAAFIEWLVLFLIAAPLTTRLPKLGHWVNEARAHDFLWAKKLAKIQPPKWAMFVGALIFAASLFGFSHLNFNERPTENFSSDHIATQSYQYLQKSRGWENAITVIFTHDDIKDERAAVESVLSDISRLPQVTATESPFDLGDFAASDVNQESAEVPRAEVQATTFFHRLFSARDQARATVYLKTSELSELENVIHFIQQRCAREHFCEATGQSVVYLEYAKKVISSLFNSFISSAVLVCLILLLLSRALNIGHSLKLIFSALWGPVAMIGFMCAFQIPVSLISSMFAAIIVGLTGDNAVQYLFAAKNQNLQSGIDARSETSVILSALLAICSLVFLFESVKPMRILGSLFFVGFIVNLVGDLWVLRGLKTASSASREV